MEHDVLIKLSKDQSIVVVKSDKTNQVVIMNKNDYIEKSMKILGDATKFKKLDKDSTRTRENRLNAILLKMKKAGEITDEQYQTMRSTGAVPGKFYGLPKTHKKDNPLRPIISNCGTYNNNGAKFLTNLLSPYSINDCSYVKDSFELAELIRQRKISKTVVGLIVEYI